MLNFKYLTQFFRLTPPRYKPDDIIRDYSLLVTKGFTSIRIHEHEKYRITYRYPLSLFIITIDAIAICYYDIRNIVQFGFYVPLPIGYILVNIDNIDVIENIEIK